jgi:hypothetical protein
MVLGGTPVCKHVEKMSHFKVTVIGRVRLAQPSGQTLLASIFIHCQWIDAISDSMSMGSEGWFLIGCGNYARAVRKVVSAPIVSWAP